MRQLSTVKSKIQLIEEVQTKKQDVEAYLDLIGDSDTQAELEKELEKIRAALNVQNVTLADAIKFLCAEVALKHQKSLQVGRYPDEEINDDNRVSATPIDKVYEHGFYPLKGGFRAVTSGKENPRVADHPGTSIHKTICQKSKAALNSMKRPGRR